MRLSGALYDSIAHCARRIRRKLIADVFCFNRYISEGDDAGAVSEDDDDDDDAEEEVVEVEEEEDTEAVPREFCPHPHFTHQNERCKKGIS